jgi:hypothetical protein
MATVDPLVMIANAINRLAAAVENMPVEQPEPEKVCEHTNTVCVTRPGIEGVRLCLDCNQEIK